MMGPFSSDKSSSNKVTLADISDPGIAALPQIKELDSLLRKLEDPQTISSAFTESDAVKFNTGEFQFDVLVENQRGSTLFGIALFSQNSLIAPLDPSSYQTVQGVPVADMNLYPLPDIFWKWSWPWWCILMIGDVDEQGFVYSRSDFKSQKWKGVYKFGSFIRRRIWIRKREKVKFATDNETSLAASLQNTASSISIGTRGTANNESSLQTSSKLQVPRRQKISNKMHRSRKKGADTNNPIEFFNNDTVSCFPTTKNNLSTGSILSDTADTAELATEVSTVSNITFQTPFQMELEKLFVEIDTLPLDRQKIDRFVSYILTTPTLERLAFLSSNENDYLSTFLNKLDHHSSKQALALKFKSHLDSIDPSIAPQMRLLINKISSQI